MLRISTFFFLRRHLWHLKGRQRTGLQQLFKAGVDNLLPMMMIMIMIMMISCLVKIVRMLMIIIYCLKGAVFAISFVSITRGKAVAASAWLKVNLEEFLY